nr:hypothetical protein PJ912_04775 [Pectobacterium colocasium]
MSLSLARHAEDTFLQVDILLQDLQERIGKDGLSPEQLTRLSEILKIRKATLPQLHGIFIYDEKGEWLVNSGVVSPVRNNYADREYFKYHQSNIGTNIYIGSVIKSRSTGIWSSPSPYVSISQTAVLTVYCSPPSHWTTLSSIMATTP